MKHPISILVLAVIIFSGCKKEDPPAPTPPPATPAPTPDPYTYSSDVEKSRDISFAVWCLADLPLPGGMVTENNFFPSEYMRLPGTGSSANELVTVRDVSEKRVSVVFNETHSRDGRLRDGAVLLSYQYHSATNPDADPAADAISDPGFAANIVCQGYRVNNWFIAASGSYLKNKNTHGFDPSTTDFLFELQGNFTFTNELLDTITLKGTISLQVANSNDTSVYKAGGPLRLENAVLHYWCDLSGAINSTPFTYKVSSTEPLVRKQSCNAQPESVSPAPTHYHPFIDGKATFGYGNFHPRTVNFGPAGVCDDVGTVSFKDEQHPVSFK